MRTLNVDSGLSHCSFGELLARPLSDLAATDGDRSTPGRLFDRSRLAAERGNGNSRTRWSRRGCYRPNGSPRVHSAATDIATELRDARVAHGAGAHAHPNRLTMAEQVANAAPGDTAVDLSPPTQPLTRPSESGSGDWSALKGDLNEAPATEDGSADAPKSGSDDSVAVQPEAGVSLRPLHHDAGCELFGTLCVVATHRYRVLGVGPRRAERVPCHAAPGDQRRGGHAVHLRPDPQGDAHVHSRLVSAGASAEPNGGAHPGRQQVRPVRRPGSRTTTSDGEEGAKVCAGHARPAGVLQRQPQHSRAAHIQTGVGATV
eukprot:ctg_2109.g548